MISLVNCQKKYNDFTLDISLEIPAGRVTGLLGRNGAGKSTTLKAILGLIRPSGGEVRVFDKNPREFSCQDKEALGVALSYSGFNEDFSVESVISVLRKMYPQFDEASFRLLCKQQEIPLRKPIRSFSTGMKAKLKVIIAVTHNAKLLVLDEPTAGLDVIARNEILDLLRNYLAEDEERTVLISSHISSDLEGFCDDVCLIDNGRLVFHEDTDTILQSYGVLKLSSEEYGKIEKEYLLASRKESFGYACLTKEKQYFLDNYPGIVVENGSLDSVIILMLGKEQFS
ncbi:MAG: ABC transporter ATP-binding protein [Lachnospiraceae bacterium]|nr:ABC transporter ATP-binding protein [Lachnospiraceae bacterium]